MTYEITEEKFLSQIAKHEMTVIRDDGVHRHLHFAKPGTGVEHFDIITYPMHLVYSGDMGCYVFSRIRDMLEFFRDKGDGPLRVNHGYWSEKLEAYDRNDHYKEYSSDRFRAYVQNWLDNQEEEAESDDVAECDRKTPLKERLDRQVLSHADDHEAFARHALASFKIGDRYPFQDSWEANFDRYSYRFVWCCFAIPWAIRLYDRTRAAVDIVAKDIANLPIKVTPGHSER